MLRTNEADSESTIAIKTHPPKPIRPRAIVSIRYLCMLKKNLKKQGGSLLVLLALDSITGPIQKTRRKIENRWARPTPMQNPHHTFPSLYQSDERGRKR